MPKKSRRIFIFAVLLGLVLLFIFGPHPKKIGVTDNSAPVASPRAETVAIKDSGDNPPYVIDIEYPKFSGFSDQAAADAVNADVTSAIQSGIRDFKANLTVPPAPGLKNNLTVRYSIAYLTPHILSFEMSVSQMVAGGAHPTTEVDTFTYDLRGGKRIRLADLFKSGADYLTTLSAYAIPQLQAQLGVKPDDAEAVDWIQSGASPKTDNYQNFLIGKDGFVVVFQQYQVAPYSEGVQRVTVPYALLANLAEPSGLLSVRMAE